MRFSRTFVTVVFALAVAGGASLPAAERITFAEHPTRLEIAIDGKPFAGYVWRDPKILRPYWAHLHAPNGVQVTRNHPPIEGRDATDHAELHPGLWLAFGDISGKDFWRNKGVVEHVAFESKPVAGDGKLSFRVRNRYVAAEATICEEACQITIVPSDSATVLVWESTFSGPTEFYFGDQEEMGLGIRVATPMTVKNGGRIVNSDGLANEKQVWGKQAAWCDYSGTVDGRSAGILLAADEGNFRRAWFHARDYGVLVANPFGQKAFTKGEASRVVVRAGQSLRLKFVVAVHSGALDLPRVPDYLRAASQARAD